MFDIEKTLAEYGLTPERYEVLLKDCSDKVHKLSDMDWSEIAEKYRIEWNGDSLRKAQQPPLLGGAFVREYYLWKNSQGKTEDYKNELTIQLRELQKEKAKIQTEKLEYNRWLREHARDELIMEHIVNAIKELEPLSIPTEIVTHTSKQDYALLFGDEHFGVEFELKDLYGNILNKYSPEIFEYRMWLLLNKTLEIINEKNIDELHVFNMGDFSDGCLRVSQLMKLRYGVVDGTIKYADFICRWLNELTKYVKVKFQMTDGNHTELRQLGQPKGTFVDDNMGKVVREFIKIRLKDNPNFVFIENPTGYIYAELANSTFLGIHGEVKNMDHAIKEFSRIYGVNIDYLAAGHLHHGRSEEVAVRSEVINVPSIIGVDSYSLSLRKTSNAGAKLLVFDSVDGLICEHKIKLN